MYFKNFLVKDPYLFYVTIYLSSEKLQKYHKVTLIYTTVKINEAYPVCSLHVKLVFQHEDVPFTPPSNYVKELAEASTSLVVIL